jgi:hypothetical protein
VVSVVRLAFTILHMDEKDLFWSAVLTSELSIVEMNVVIIAPCLLFLPAFLKTSKSSLYSLRSRLLGRSRFADSKESSLRDRISYDKDNAVKIQVQQQQQQQQQQDQGLTFITEADSHSAHSTGSAGKVGSGHRRASDAYCPV